jgi:hypothetical protein
MPAETRWAVLPGTTVTEATTGDQVTTPIIISESESSSQMSSDLGAKEDKIQSSKLRLEQQSICERPPSKMRRIQPPVHGEVERPLNFVRDALLESIDSV